MIWVIEFRSGTYLQPNRSGGPLRTAQQFESQEAADGFIDAHEWVALNGGMAKLVRVSRYLDLELAARIILRTLPPGSLSAPPSAVATLQQKLMDLCQAIWTQGWDCREEQGPLAGAFEHAQRYNPYRRDTIKGSESIPGDAVHTLQLFPDKEIPSEDLAVVIHKMRDQAIPTMEYLAGPLCEQEGGVVADGRHTRGICTFGPGHEGRHSWEPDED